MVSFACQVQQIGQSEPNLKGEQIMERITTIFVGEVAHEISNNKAVSGLLSALKAVADIERVVTTGFFPVDTYNELAHVLLIMSRNFRECAQVELRVSHSEFVGKPCIALEVFGFHSLERMKLERMKDFFQIKFGAFEGYNWQIVREC
jgi:hypothetical protein